MRQVSVHTTIAAPRERVFDLVADLAARPAFTDHFLDDYRLARANPYGAGAAARFRLRGRLARDYGGLEIERAERPRLIVERLRVGRRGRNRFVAVCELQSEAGGVTRVELNVWGEPATPLDALRQLLAAGWVRRQTGIALERLRLVFEDPPPGALRRATVAGWEPWKAARFGARPGMDPGRAPRLGERGGA